MVKKSVKETIHAKGLDISIYTEDFQNEFISLTDIARYKSDEPFIVINNWMRGKDTIEFLGLWEQLHNPDFKPIEFDRFRQESGYNAFTLSPQKWIKATNSIGITSKSGRYGGTFAHKDIAFEFASWISSTFKLYLITEYQRLKEMETNQYNLEWNVKRILSKTNYHIHTDAVKNFILPDKNYEKDKEWIAYAEEADLLNVALFNCTAKDWREVNPNLAKKSMNIRDIASINELAILSNLETLNAQMIKEKVNKPERFEKLRDIAKYQLTILNEKDFMKALKKLNDNVFIDKRNRLEE